MTRDQVRTITSGAAGNIIEWFDFAVYGYLAAVMGQLFFPSEDAFVSTIAAFGSFAAGYLMRPIGGAVFGYIGDRFGARSVLLWSVLMMGGASCLIALLPTYETIGVAAPVALIILRMVQGFSVGGEFTGSIVYLVETADDDRRGFFGATSNTGAVLGFLVGSGVAALLANLLDAEQMASWGWRLPFACGVLIAAAAFVMRTVGLETAEHEPGSVHDRNPVWHAVRDHWRDILRIAGLVVSANVAFYMMFVYAISLLTDRYHADKATTLDINTLNMALMAGFVLLAGWLADRLGRRPMILGTAAALVLLSTPLMWLMYHDNPTMIFLGQLGFAAICAGGLGVNPVTLVEIVPRGVRCTVISVGYNLTLAIFGGTTPVVAAWLVGETDLPLAPEIYLIILGLITFAVGWRLPETRGKPL